MFMANSSNTSLEGVFLGVIFILFLAALSQGASCVKLLLYSLSVSAGNPQPETLSMLSIQSRPKRSVI
jgi:hypothetical protein